MSCVCLLSAARPMPLREGGGFAVRPHSYHREAVEDLGLPMAPCARELELPAEDGAAARALRAYLERTMAPGERVELWHLWVGQEAPRRAVRYAGRLEDLDGAAIAQLRERYQTCMAVGR